MFNASDNGFILAGVTQIGTSYDAIIVKTNQDGESLCNEQNLNLIDKSGNSSKNSGLNINHEFLNYDTVVFLEKNLSTGVFSFCFDCLLPVSEFSYSISGLNVDFTDLSIGEQGYLWNFGDGNISYNDNPNHIYSNYNSYQVCLSVDNVCGTDSLCHNIDLLGNSIGDMSASNNINVFPIPSKDHLFIEISMNEQINNEPFDLMIYDANGRIVEVKTHLKPGFNQLNISDWSNGKYFYRLSQNGNSIGKGLIIKSK